MSTEKGGLRVSQRDIGFTGQCTLNLSAMRTRPSTARKRSRPGDGRKRWPWSRWPWSRMQTRIGMSLLRPGLRRIRVRSRSLTRKRVRDDNAVVVGGPGIVKWELVPNWRRPGDYGAMDGSGERLEVANG